MINEIFIKAPTRAGFEAALQGGNVKATSVVFIEDTNELWTQNKYYQFVPSGGEKGQILTNNGMKGVWSNEGISVGLEDILSYGVEWTKNATSPILTRIGNLSLHKSLPIQSQYKGCVVDVATKTVKYWLDPEDWSKKADGTAAVLDGTDGQVMVHTPKFYGKSGEKDGKYWVRISTQNVDGTWTEIPEMFIAAYRGTVNNTNNKAASVVNTDAAYRGGNNRSAYDEYLDTDPCKSDLGKPRTNASRATFRTWARNLGAELLSYEQYKWAFYWAYVIEYANFNSQAAYNANLDAEGMHQGGLGDGVTTWDGTSWNNYNGYYPLTPCGYANDLGNGTGVKAMTAGTKSFNVPRWRGFDNPFGDIWTNLDGIIIQGDAEGNPKSVYTTTDPTAYGDDAAAQAKMTVVGHEIHQDGYTKEFDLGENAEIIPAVMGGDVTVGKCDYHWTGAKDTSLRTLLVGGSTYYGGMAGLGCFNSLRSVGVAYANFGFRFVITL